MKKLHKFIVTLILAICLPLQGLAAVTMPACQGMNGNMHHTAEVSVAASHQQHHNTSKLSCDQCFSCAMCAAPTMAAMPLVIVLQDKVESYPQQVSRYYQTFTSLPFHPPKVRTA